MTAEEMFWGVVGGIFLLAIVLFPYFLLWNAEDSSSPSYARGLGGCFVCFQLALLVSTWLGAPWGETLSQGLVVLGFALFFIGLGGGLGDD